MYAVVLWICISASRDTAVYGGLCHLAVCCQTTRHCCWRDPLCSVTPHSLLVTCLSTRPPLKVPTWRCEIMLTWTDDVLFLYRTLSLHAQTVAFLRVQNDFEILTVSCFLWNSFLRVFLWVMLVPDLGLGVQAMFFALDFQARSLPWLWWPWSEVLWADLKSKTEDFCVMFIVEACFFVMTGNKPVRFITGWIIFSDLLWSGTCVISQPLADECCSEKHWATSHYAELVVS